MAIRVDRHRPMLSHHLCRTECGCFVDHFTGAHQEVLVNVVCSQAPTLYDTRQPLNIALPQRPVAHGFMKYT
jgi:hypothetical protein